MTIFTKTYDAPELNRREIRRYAGCGRDGELPLLDECLQELLPQLSYKVCYTLCDIVHDGDTLTVGTVKTDSTALCKNLNGCERAVIFTATVGLAPDRLVRKYGVLSPSKAVVMQAIGAERIESLCDTFCREWEGQGLYLRPRFSPGYGDLPLSAQQDIFALLDCPRKIGVTLTEHLLMMPSKSVSAIVGISETPVPHGNKCTQCNKKNCSFRGDTSCPF